MFKKVKCSQVIGIAMALTSTQLAADEAASSTWKGEAELGYISTSGNTETETLNAKAKVTNERKVWKHTIIAEATKASDNDTVTTQRNFISSKTDYKFTEGSYIFGLLTYEDDRFSGYDYQASLIVGYGHKFINTDLLTWDGEIGVGTRRSKPDSGEKTDEDVLYLGTELDWKISKTASINEKLTVEAGHDATTTKSVLALKAKINNTLASKITYTIKHVSEVPVGIEKTDKEIAVTLVYNF